MIPCHNGDRGSPSPVAHAPRAPLPTALFFQVQFLPLLLYRVSLSGRVPYGVATLASVISDDLAAVARLKGVPGPRR